MMDEIDLVHGERIAVLETKVDTLQTSVNELKELLEPMTALYKAGRFVIWVGGVLMSYTHWDQIVAFVSHLLNPPKH